MEFMDVNPDYLKDKIDLIYKEARTLQESLARDNSLIQEKATAFLITYTALISIAISYINDQEKIDLTLLWLMGIPFGIFMIFAMIFLIRCLWPINFEPPGIDPNGFAKLCGNSIDELKRGTVARMQRDILQNARVVNQRATSLKLGIVAGSLAPIISFIIFLLFRFSGS